MLPPDSNSKQYAVSVNTDDICEAIMQVSEALYDLAQEALATHLCEQEDDCEFQTFARDVLGVLDQHADDLPCRAHPSTGGDGDGDIHI